MTFTETVHTWWLAQPIELRERPRRTSPVTVPLYTPSAESAHKPALCYRGNGIWLQHSISISGICERCKKQFTRGGLIGK